MENQPHIIVLGGGLIGLSCADNLMSRRARVTLVEKTDRIGLGAGQYNSGMIHPSQSSSWLQEPDISVARKVFSLAQKSKDLLQKRRQELNCRDIDRKPGILQLFDSQYAGMQARQFYSSLGVTAELVAGPFTYQRYAVKLPGDESGDAFSFMQALWAELSLRGAQMLTGKTTNLSIESSKCTGLMIEDEFMSSDGVVVACGAASVDVFRSIGLKIPVKPLVGHALSFDRPDISLPDIPLLHWDTRSALTVFENEVRLSGTAGEETPDALLEIWEEIAPDIIAALGEPRVRWSANRPASTIGRPVIGKTAVEGLWINSGHGHMGWSLCSASGQLMADMIMDGREAPEFALPDCH